MTDLSNLLDKEVILTPENEHETVLIKVDKDEVVLAKDIDPNKWKLRTR